MVCFIGGGNQSAVYPIQHYVIKFVSDSAAGQWFSPGTLVSSTDKTDHHDITEILLKVALNDIRQTNKQTFYNKRPVASH
jgi:hypothetical protein